MKILVVDDEPIARTSVRRLLERRGHTEVDLCAAGAEAIAAIRARDYDIVLLDLLMPGMDGMEVLAAAKPHAPATEFILLTAVDDVSKAVQAVHLGAYDYLVKPVDNDRLMVTLQHALERKGLQAGLAGHDGRVSRAAEIPKAFSAMVTGAPRMREILAYTAIMARSGMAILITGESGTGKELLARGIHACAPTADGPFVAVNVASIPAPLFESQFFGHRKGAFTGAMEDHAGFFEQAGSGSLFLDEVGELPPALQAKLLRTLEDGCVTRVGAAHTVPVAARIISATNQDLEKECRAGRFRTDLLYRLKAAHIHLPPLRERREDIPLLITHFWRSACQQYGKGDPAPPPRLVDELLLRDFPGNVRELRHAVVQAVLLADAPQALAALGGHGGPPSDSPPAEVGLCSLKESDERHVRFVLEQTGGNRQAAARILGITERQLYRRLASMRDQLAAGESPQAGLRHRSQPPDGATPRRVSAR